MPVTTTINIVLPDGIAGDFYVLVCRFKLSRWLAPAIRASTLSGTPAGFSPACLSFRTKGITSMERR
jgi:hypothetical protein